MLLRHEDLKHHTLQPREFVYRKRHLQKDSLQPHWKGHYQVLLTNPCAMKLPRNRLLDPCVTSKESTKPWLDLHPSWWPKSKDIQELKHTIDEGNSFPNMTSLYIFSLLLLLALSSPSLSWKDNALTHTSQSTAKEEKFSNCQICTRNLSMSMTVVTL